MSSSSQSEENGVIPSGGFKYAALVSYVGTNFCGWQKQKGSAADGSPSIQAAIEAALHRITGETPTVVGSGRTDSGVHAVGQVTHFRLMAKEWECEILRRGMNTFLKTAEIQVMSVQKVPMTFHAQHSANKKQYSYYFQQGPSALPHLEPYSWWIYKRLDQKALQRALNYLIGEHDFKPFQASGAKPGPTIRTVLAAELEWQPLPFPCSHSPIAASPVGLIRVRLVGTGFLKQMVRGIAGTLLQVGEGRRQAECFEEILKTRDRRLVGPTAPSRALWLERVWYSRLHW